MISNHLGQGHVNTEGNAMVTGIKSSPSSGSNKVLSSMEPQQSNRQSAVFHNSVYTASPPKNENQNLDRESNKVKRLNNFTFFMYCLNDCEIAYIFSTLFFVDQWI